MKFYQEITLIPNDTEEIPIYYLWSKIYQQVHLALVESLEGNLTRIGLAFPQYRDDIHLGCKLRLFAESEQELNDLDINKWLNRLTDYVHITSIREVPKDTAYANFKRYQPSAVNKERLARRRAKRHNQTYEQALAYYHDFKPKRIREPFIRLKSLTNGNQLCLFIKKKGADCFVNEGFSSYGLSKTSSVPDF